jgi:SagB-type dehydrogenase family enzyme
MSIGKEFIEKTKHKYLEISDQQKGITQPPLELDYDKSKRLIDLPRPEHIRFETKNVRECFDKRRSFRDYSNKSMSIDELSYLLWYTQGVKEIKEKRVTIRTVPSAGARHAFETYVLVQNVNSLKNGIYRYLAIEHKLVEYNCTPGIAEKIQKACFDQDLLMSCAALFIWTAVAARMKWRYGERSYRYFFLDAGHVCQNLYLAAESIGLGACAVGAFDDDAMNFLLGLDGEEQFVVYAGAAGKK